MSVHGIIDPYILKKGKVCAVTVTSLKMLKNFYTGFAEFSRL